jgi:hypothetical protein
MSFDGSDRTNASPARPISDPHRVTGPQAQDRPPMMGFVISNHHQADGHRRSN